MGARHNSNMGPAAICDEFRSHDVLSERLTLAMVITVVLDGDHDVFPTHIEEIAGVAEVVENWNLRSRSWKSGANE